MDRAGLLTRGQRRDGLRCVQTNALPLKHGLRGGASRVVMKKMRPLTKAPTLNTALQEMAQMGNETPSDKTPSSKTE